MGGSGEGGVTPTLGQYKYVMPESLPIYGLDRSQRPHSFSLGRSKRHPFHKYTFLCYSKFRNTLWYPVFSVRGHSESPIFSVTCRSHSPPFLKPSVAHIYHFHIWVLPHLPLFLKGRYMGHVMQKYVLSHMQATKVQISLCICAVWSAPLLFAA